MKRNSFEADHLSAEVTKFTAKPSIILWLAAITALLQPLSGGLVIGFYNGSIKSMANETAETIDWNEDKKTWIAAAFPIGGMIGSLVAGPTLGKLGPRMSILLNSFGFIFGWLLIILSNHFWLIFIGRILGGFSLGFSSGAVPVYVLEISTEGLRSALGVSFQLMINVGIVLAFILAYSLNYQWVAGISVIFAIVIPFLMYLCPESPGYLNNKHGAAGRELVIGSLTRLRSPDSQPELEYESLNRKDPVEANLVGSLESRNDVSPPLLKPLLLSFGVSFFQQMTGNNAVISYQSRIFTESGFTLDERVCSIITGLVLVACTFVGAWLIGRVGRKPLLLISGAGMSVSIITLGAYFSLSHGKGPEFGASWGWVALLSLIVFLAVFSIGFGPITWLIVPEMTPYKHRALVTSLATFFNWTIVFLIIKLFTSLVDWLSMAGAFYFFGLIAAGSCAFVWFLLPETRGKSFEELERLFVN